MFVKIGDGSVKPFRKPNTSRCDRDNTTRVFEYQSRWSSGLVPSNLGMFLIVDVTAFTGSSMSTDVFEFSLGLVRDHLELPDLLSLGFRFFVRFDLG